MVGCGLPGSGMSWSTRGSCFSCFAGSFGLFAIAIPFSKQKGPVKIHREPARGSLRGELFRARVKADLSDQITVGEKLATRTSACQMARCVASITNSSSDSEIDDYIIPRLAA